MNCIEKQQVSIASFMFQGKAEHWWEAEKDGTEISRKELEVPNPKA